jgi:hypothetical protein
MAAIGRGSLRLQGAGRFSGTSVQAMLMQPVLDGGHGGHATNTGPLPPRTAQARVAERSDATCAALAGASTGQAALVWRRGPGRGQLHCGYAQAA